MDTEQSDEEEELAVGMRFQGKEKFKIAVARYLALSKRGCFFPDNNKEKITARCKSKSCGFSVRGRGRKDGSLHISSMDLTHGCAAGSHAAANTAIISEAAASILRYNASAKAHDVIDRCRVDYGVQVKYKQAYDALQIQHRSLKHVSSTSYAYVCPWAEAMTRENPGSRVDVVRGESQRLERVFISLKQWTDNAAFCIPVVALDATHLHSKDRGTMFIASCLSPNRDIVVVPLAIGMIEDGDHWEWFLRNLRVSSDVFLAPEMIFISDREKGLSTAVQVVYPEVPHSYCAFHIKKNVKVNCKTDPNNKINAIAKSLTPREYTELMTEAEEEHPAGAKYLKETADVSTWVTCFFTRPRFGQVTTNFGEAANSWFLPERKETWFACLSDIVRKIQVRSFEKSQEYDDMTSEFAPWVVAKVKKSIREAQKRLVAPSSNDVVEVSRRSDYSYAKVQLDLRLCSCGFWTEFGYPCVHAPAALQFLGHDPLAWISPIYSTARLRQAFGAKGSGVDTRTLQPLDTQPPLIQVHRGRPRSVRIRNRSEYLNNDSPVHCSNCGVAGHNVRTCERRKKKAAKAAKERQQRLEARRAQGNQVE